MVRSKRSSRWSRECSPCGIHSLAPDRDWVSHRYSFGRLGQSFTERGLCQQRGRSPGSTVYLAGAGPCAGPRSIACESPGAHTGPSPRNAGCTFPRYDVSARRTHTHLVRADLARPRIGSGEPGSCRACCPPVRSPMVPGSPTECPRFASDRWAVSPNGQHEAGRTTLPVSRQDLCCAGVRPYENGRAERPVFPDKKVHPSRGPSIICSAPVKSYACSRAWRSRPRRTGSRSSASNSRSIPISSGSRVTTTCITISP